MLLSVRPASVRKLNVDVARGTTITLLFEKLKLPGQIKNKALWQLRMQIRSSNILTL